MWCETSKPDIAQARRFAEAIHARYPDQLLAYNCSPSFNWQKNVDAATMRHWREELAAMGYRFQFITLAGWHALNLSMFELASAYRDEGMYGYSQLQQREFAHESAGYRAAKHQAFVGTGYFDAVQTAVTAGQFSTGAMAGSTEDEQFDGSSGQANPGHRPVNVLATRCLPEPPTGRRSDESAGCRRTYRGALSRLQRRVRPHHAARGRAFSQWRQRGPGA